LQNPRGQVSWPKQRAGAQASSLGRKNLGFIILGPGKVRGGVSI